jgi:hypothetical protein
VADLLKLQKLIEGNSRQVSIRLSVDLIELSTKTAESDGFENLQALVKNLLLKYLDDKKVL